MPAGPCWASLQCRGRRPAGLCGAPLQCRGRRPAGPCWALSSVGAGGLLAYVEPCCISLTIAGSSLLAVVVVVDTIFECRSCLGINHFLTQLVPPIHHSLTEELLPGVESTSLFLHLKRVSSWYSSTDAEKPIRLDIAEALQNSKGLDLVRSLSSFLKANLYRTFPSFVHKTTLSFRLSISWIFAAHFPVSLHPFSNVGSTLVGCIQVLAWPMSCRVGSY